MKKGFTLVELIAVVVILGIILVIAVPRITDVIDNVVLESYKKQEKLLIKAATFYLVDNPDKVPSESSATIVTLNELKSVNLIDKITNFRDKSKECDAYVEIENMALTLNYRAFMDCGDSYITAGFYGLGDPIYTTYGDGGYDLFFNVDITSDGYVAVGYSNSTNKDMEGLNKGSTSAIIVRYDNNGNILWNRAFGGTATDFFNDVVTVNDGFIAVGYSESTDQDLEGLNKGHFDAIIVKYDQNGNMMWNRNFGGTGDDRFEGVITVNDGYIVAGRSWSNNGDLSGFNKGGWDGIVVKYDIAGNVNWKKNFGGSSTDNFYGISNAENGFIVIGNSYSNNHDVTGLQKGGGDAVIVRYDSNGNVIWNRNFGGSSFDIFYDVKEVIDGYVAVGYSNSNNHDVLDMNKGLDDAVIVKYDKSGNMVWNKNFGGSHVDYFRSIEIINNNYVVIGQSQSNNQDLTGLNRGGWDGIVVKYDPNGDVIMKQNHGGTSTDIFLGSSGNESNFVAVGYSSSSNHDFTGKNKGSVYATIASYNDNGSVQWTESFGGGPGEDYFRGIVEVDDGYIAMGYSSSISGDLTGLNKGGWDSILVKYDYNGKMIWKKNIGGTSTDHFFRGIRITNGFMAAGLSCSTNGDMAGLTGKGCAAVLFKFDNNGEIIGRKHFGGTSTDYFHSVVEDEDGYVAVGYAYSSNGDLLGMNNGGLDGIIAKFDKDFNLLWVNHHGGSNHDYFFDVTIAEDGYIAVGYSDSTNGHLNGLNKGGRDAIIVKFDKNGNRLWSRNYGGTNDDRFEGIITIPGGYVAAGRSNSTNGDLQGINKGGWDAILVKYDNHGNIIWKRNYGGTSTEYFHNIKNMKNISDGFITVGYGGSTNEDFVGMQTFGGGEALVLFHDLNGDIIWKNYYGGRYSEFFYDVTPVRDGYVAVGHTNSADNIFYGIGTGFNAAITIGIKPEFNN